MTAATASATASTTASTTASAMPVETAPELDFTVTDAGVLEHAAAPTLRSGLGTTAPEGVPVRPVSPTAQIRIAATRRSYDAETKERLVDLFGTPDRWGTTLRSLLWAHASTVVTPFEGSTTAELAMPCSYDFDVAATRYLAGVRDGAVPLELLFSGTVFYADGAGRLQAARLPWDREATFSLPAETWTEMMDHYFPGTAWLRLDRRRFDRLCAYRSRHAMATWEETVDALLGAAEEPRGESTP